MMASELRGPPPCIERLKSMGTPGKNSVSIGCTMHHSEEELLKGIVLLFILTFLDFYVIIYTENERRENKNEALD